MTESVERNSKAPGARCWECPFINAPFVPTQNPQPTVKLAVIGEAPGHYEAAGGIPFTGPSGRLLNQVMDHYGYSRNDIMVTNVCLCRPQNNDDPPKAAIEACAPRLRLEIAQSGVEKILAVGGTAASTLIDPKKKISKLRIGPPKPYIDNPEIDVVATWHPAFCLRSPDHFPSLVSDAAKLRGTVREQFTFPTYKVFDSIESSLMAIERLWDIAGPLVIDIETGFDKDETFDHPDHYELLCIGISYSIGRVAIFGTNALKDQIVIEKLGELLKSKKIVGHNIKSDIAGLDPVFGRIEAIGDTMLQNYTQDERPGQHALEKLGIERLGAPPWKSSFKELIPRGGSYADAPRSKLYEYNSIDVDVTRRLYELNLSEMDERQHREHAFLMRAANAIVNLERAGITLDREYNDELSLLFTDELNKLEIEISNLINRDLNPRSPMQIKDYFKTKKLDIPTTEADYLESLKEKIHDDEVRSFIDLLLLHRRRTKLYGTYVKGFRKRLYKNKIYTTYTLHGTTSGRLASKNPNMQNIVRDKRIKHQFTVEDPRNILIQIDYKQAEGRVITALAQDEYLASIFNDPTRDLFNELCTSIHGVDKWNVFSSEKKKEERVKIKSVFYGLAYGRGAAAIGVELGISLNEAQKLLHDFKSLIPATVHWQTSVKELVLSGKDLVTSFGRKRSFWLITDQNRSDVLNEALSYLPQSTASDICLTALIELQQRLKGLATTRLTVHDALIFECKESDLEETISIAKHEMVKAGEIFTDFVRFEVDASWGKRWSDL